MGINFDVKNTEELLSKVPYKSILFVITLISGLLLFLPDNILGKLYLIDLRNIIGTYLGVTFIICLLIWCIIFSKIVFKKIRNAIAFSDKNCKKRFEQISEEGLNLILMMYHSKSHSMKLDMTDANVAVLESCYFIGRGPLSVSGTKFDYYLELWVIEYLNKHISEYTHFNDSNLKY